MRVIVLGGTGFIGPPTVRLLIEAGHDVTVFHRGETETELPAGVRHLHGDRSELMGFRNTFRQIAPDVLLDMRAMTELDAKSTVGTFSGIAGRAVVLSSCDVYRAYDILLLHDSGPLQSAPLKEDDELRRNPFPYRGKDLRSPDDPDRWMDEYDKIPVERIFLSDRELPGTILRLPAVYGERDRRRRLFPLAKRIADGRRTLVLDEAFARWRFTHGYVENVAAAIALAVTDVRAAGRIYNVGEPETPTQAQWAKRVAAAAGWQLDVLAIPGDRLPAQLIMQGANPAQDLMIDSTRIREELGYVESVSWEEGIRRTIAWETEHPPAEIDPAAFDYDAEDSVAS